jgi:uncharacterized membrane protein YbhN (UPF0104 family)
MIDQSSPCTPRTYGGPWRARRPAKVSASTSPRTGWELLVKMLRPAISVGLLSWLAWRTDWDRLAEAFGRMQLQFWLAAVGVYLAAQFLSSLRWQLLARPLGFHEPLRQFTAFYFIGMFFNLFLPTSVGGDVVRAWCLDGKTGRRLNAFLSVLVDRISGLMILLLVACVGVAVYPQTLPVLVTGSVWGMAAGAILGLLLLPALTGWTARFERLSQLSEGVRFYFHHPRLMLGTTVLSVGVQLANVVLVWCLGLAIGVPVPAVYYLILVPLVSLLTLLPISLNGMGIREWTTALFLGQLGVGEGAALCLALLWFLVLTAVSCVGGIVYLSGSLPRPEGHFHHGSVGGDSHQGRAGQSQAAA